MLHISNKGIVSLAAFNTIIRQHLLQKRLIVITLYHSLTCVMLHLFIKPPVTDE